MNTDFKKNYVQPLFNVVTIDHEISLVMMTGNDPSDPPANPSFKGQDNDDTKRQDPFASPFE